MKLKIPKILEGDSLIEVLLAMVIFSASAVATVGAMNYSLFSAQGSLEISMARNEIDAQAEALRFIHDAYAGTLVNTTSVNLTSNYKDIWNAISSSANSNKNDGAPIDPYQSPTVCSQIYDEGVLSTYHAFALDTRNLANATSVSFIGADKTRDDGGAPYLQEASTFPRLVYGTTADGETDLINNNPSNSLYSVEGIWIYGIPSSTTIDDGRGGSQPEFFDFYINTCWYPQGQQHASTITTTIRLYDPRGSEATHIEVPVIYRNVTFRVTEEEGRYYKGNIGYTIDGDEYSVVSEEKCEDDELSTCAITVKVTKGSRAEEIFPNAKIASSFNSLTVTPTGINYRYNGSEITTVFDHYGSIPEYINDNIEIEVYFAGCKIKHICYDDQGADGGSMADQSASPGATVTLHPSNFWKDDYGFAGWTTQPNGRGDRYGPMQDFTMPEDGRGVRLYANWIKSAGTFQGGSSCSDGVTALTDTRDGNTYAVAKLKDGNCWMIENLRLDHNGIDNEGGSLAQGYGTADIRLFFRTETRPAFKGLPNIDPSDVEYFRFDLLNDIVNFLGDLDRRLTDENFSALTRGLVKYRRENTNSTSSNTGDGRWGNVYSFGNYYNFNAATADFVHDTKGAGVSVTNTSICPKGWRLPVQTLDKSYKDIWLPIPIYDIKFPFNRIDSIQVQNGYKRSDESTDDFQTLLNGLNNTIRGDTVINNSTLLRAYPNNFIYSGEGAGTSIDNRGTKGFYWTSTMLKVDVLKVMVANRLEISESATKTLEYTISAKEIIDDLAKDALRFNYDGITEKIAEAIDGSLERFDNQDHGYSIRCIKK